MWYHQSLDRIVHRLWFEQWQLGCVKTDPDTKDDSASSAPTSNHAVLTEHTLADFAIIDSPARTWWADPHLYQHDGALYVFSEEMQINADHGHLSVARLSDDKQATEVTKITDDGQHLSYPFVFSADGDVYMIPETAARKSVLLYRAERFPDRWALVRNCSQVSTGQIPPYISTANDGECSLTPCHTAALTSAMNYNCISLMRSPAPGHHIR